MNEELVKVDLAQKSLGGKTIISVWVRKGDEFVLDSMIQKNVKIEAEKIAKKMAEEYFTQAMKNGFDFLLNLKK